AADKDRALVTATEAKNKFGRLLERAMQGGVVVITKHDAPKAVLISMDEYTALASAPESRINTLSAEFDSLLMRMQRPGARNGMKASGCSNVPSPKNSILPSRPRSGARRVPIFSTKRSPKELKSGFGTWVWTVSNATSRACAPGWRTADTTFQKGKFVNDTLRAGSI